MLRSIRIVPTLLVPLTFHCLDHRSVEPNAMCTTMACSTTLTVNFSTARTTNYSIEITGAGRTYKSDCTYSAAQNRWESNQDAVMGCNASEITLNGSGMQAQTNLSVLLKDNLGTTVENKQYAVSWQGPHYPNGESCDKPYNMICYTGTITNTAP